MKKKKTIVYVSSVNRPESAADDKDTDNKMEVDSPIVISSVS